eukprot:11070550-Heterocapsa_arctica.AAC.1
MDGLATPVPPDKLSALDAADGLLRRAAQRAGITNPASTRRPKRAPGGRQFVGNLLSERR